MSQVDFNDPDAIKALTAALEAAGVDGIEITAPHQKLRIVLGQKPSVTVQGQAHPTQDPRLLKAPMAGIFLKQAPARPSEQGHEPASSNASGALGFLRVGPILLPLSHHGATRARKYLVQQGDVVSFGDALIEVELE